ncbi:MAG TPA: CGNR zinc finger domain-containing protein [Micromonosporaceae bacterium]|jgi:predicted RNA-binding Zn ribbon-like protein
MFDSHIRRLLETSAALVNGLTGGHAHGKPFVAPSAAGAPEVARTALGIFTTIGPEAAADLIATAASLRRIYAATAAGSVDEAAEIVNSCLLATGARPQLDRVPGEPWQLHFHGRDDSIGTGWGAGCFAAVALAVGSDLAGRLGVCAAERCDRVYVDTSRNAGRQFCSTICQNRTKTASYRARRAG